MNRLFLIFTMLCCGFALNGASIAPEFGQSHHDNHRFSIHHAKTHFGKHFFKPAEESSTKKLSISALLLGLFSTAATALGCLAFFYTVSASFIVLFMIGVALGIGGVAISAKLLKSNDLNPGDTSRAVIGLFAGILGLTLVLPVLLLEILEVD